MGSCQIGSLGLCHVLVKSSAGTPKAVPALYRPRPYRLCTGPGRTGPVLPAQAVPSLHRPRLYRPCSGPGRAGPLGWLAAG